MFWWQPKNIENAHLVITLSSSSPNFPPINMGSSTNITSDVVDGGKDDVEGDFFLVGFVSDKEGVLRGLRFLGACPLPPNIKYHKIESIKIIFKDNTFFAQISQTFTSACFITSICSPPTFCFCLEDVNKCQKM